MTSVHETVLLHEAVDALITDDRGVYVDGTFGRGGHSCLVLQRLNEEGRLLGFDKDPLAIAEGERLQQQDARFSIHHGSFVDLPQVMTAEGIAPKSLSGVLLDLGVSSPQLDEAERGFSFTKDGPLDMRMNPEADVSAASWINSVKESEMAEVFKNYGEERFAKRIARAVVEERARAPFERTLHLADVVAKANPAWEKHKHPATRVFQAVRIEINRELLDLQQMLECTLEALRPGGRLVVISFHSLEDRIVKRFIREQEKGKALPKGLPVTEQQLDKKLRSVGRAIKPGQEEVSNNVRARSAIMRIAEKL